MASEGSHPEPLRASQVFEAWLVRRMSGQGEPFERLLEEHPDLRASLEALRRSDAQRETVLPRREALPARPEARHAFGDFRILRTLGEGAMGVVYAAEQVSMRRPVALKVLKPELTLNTRALQRFWHEAEITGRLQHPNIISIHQVGEAEGVHFISMELVEGTSLDRVIERMRRGSRPPARPTPPSEGDVLEAHGLEEREPSPMEPGARAQGGRKGSSAASNKGHIESAVRLVCQVADALDHAHGAGVLHRDVKPSNVLVRRDGNAVLTDFGLAREQGLPTVSQTGDFVGTAHYVSPEQAMSGRVPIDGRADVFSLGATLYELLTLELAFPGDTLHSVLAAVVSKPPRDPSQLNPALAPDLVTILLKALEKDPDQRYASAAALAEDLRAFIDYRPIRARRTPTAVRALRWIRREPLKAALAATMIVGIPLVSALGWNGWNARRTAEARGDELAFERLPKRLEEGFLALGIGDPEEASTLFEDVRRHAPSSVEAVAGQVLAQLADGRAEEAQRVLAEAETELGSSSLLERLHVHLLRDQHRTEEALAIERELPPIQDHLDRFLRAMQLLQGSPFLCGAPTAAQLVVPTSSETQGRETSPGGRRRASLEWSDKGDPSFQARERASEASELLTRAIDVESDRAMYHFARAWAVWLARDPEAASRSVDAILAKWPELPIARFYCGLAAEVLDPETALAHYEVALAGDPDLEAALARRANLNLRQDRLPLALAQLEELIARHPERPAHRVNLAFAWIESGEFDQAIAAARSALVRDLEYVPAHDALATAYFNGGDLDRAEEAFRTASELEPRAARLKNDLGVVLLAMERYDEAEAALARALELSPNYPFALYNLGILALVRSEPERAARELEGALERHDPTRTPEFPAHLALQALAKARDRMGKDPLEALQRALELAPDHAGLNADLGMALGSRGRFAEAAGPLTRGLPADEAGELHRALVITLLDRLGRAEQALPVAVAWSDRFPDQAEAWNYRASIQVDPCRAPLGDPEDGLMSAERAHAISPEDYNVLDTYACALLASLQSNDALDYAMEALDRAEAARADQEILAEMRRHIETIEAAAE